MHQHQSVLLSVTNDTLMNGAFASDLSEFIMDRPQIKMWTHGHMHNVSDYMVGDTRVFVILVVMLAMNREQKNSN
jgi:hypothetical protein